ncbi:MAG: hypothetical protein IPG79_03360 [Saprospiraceae bacterium]|nr:hypothetical protein [Saprospiraceae bacterium]
MNKYLILSTVFIFFIASLGAQNNEAGTTKTAQPTIMVIPFAKQNQNLRTVLENDELARIAITKVKEAFDQRGVNTIDLRAKLKQKGMNEALQEDQVSETKDAVIANSGADIYVEVEASKNYSSTGNSVNIIMTAYDAFSGESLANKTANSPKVYTDNFEKLVEKAIQTELSNLMNTIQEKFNDIRENGRSVVVTIGVAETSDIHLQSEVDDSGDYLSEIVEDWMSKNAFKGQFHVQGSTKNKIIFDLVKVPLYDEQGNNYRVSVFSRSIRNFLRSKSIDVTADIQGNNLLFTINGPK